MSTILKVLLVIAVGMFALCAIAAAGTYVLWRSTGWAAKEAFETDPGKASDTAGRIADYELPAGFKDAYTADVAGYIMVGYTGQDGHSHVYSFQLPADVTVDTSDIVMQARTAFEPGRSRYPQTRVVEEKPGVIAGQKVTLVYSEGVDHEGKAFREVTAAFQGKGGQALVVFSRPASAWDQAEVDRFLASIQ